MTLAQTTRDKDRLFLENEASWPPELIGLAKLTKIAFRGGDLQPIAIQLFERLCANPNDAAALFDLGTIYQLTGKRTKGIEYQARAIALEQVFRQSSIAPVDKGVRLLMFAVPGDFMANTPVEFILEDLGVALDIVYLNRGASLPTRLPPHNVALVGVSPSSQSQSVLEQLPALLEQWPLPVLNHPRRVMNLSRERLWQVLDSAPGIDIPITVVVHREHISMLGRGEILLQWHLPDAKYPIIARPVDSHAGHGLQKLDDGAAVSSYLQMQSDDSFYISRFVDYRSADGLFRKYRIALIEGRPYVCHMAVAGHWMLHYLNAGMTEDASKRAEEAMAMATFDEEFARRHAVAFHSLVEKVGLDYFAVDCGETRDGKLLVFEADTGMIIHDMDPPDLFPYKHPQMVKVFEAFRKMLVASMHDGKDTQLIS